MSEEFKTKLLELLKKFDKKQSEVENIMKSITTVGGNSNFKKLDATARDQVMLNSCELAFKEGLEIENAFALLDLASKTNKECAELLLKLKETLEKEEYKKVPSKLRKEDLAIKGIKAGIAYDIRVKTKRFSVVILGKSTPREIKKADGSTNVNGVVGVYIKSLEDGMEPFYRSLMFWGEQAQKIKSLVIGHLYEVNLSHNAASDKADAWVPVDKTEFIDKGRYTGDILADMDNVKNVKRIKLVEGEFNITKGYDEYQRVDVSVLSRQVFQSKGKDIGKLLVDDGTIDDMVLGSDGEDNPVGGFTIFSDPQNLTQGEGSEVAIIGRISRSKKNDQISMQGDAIIPIFTIPIEVVPMKKEDDAPMKSGDENVIDPSKLGDGIPEDIVPDDISGLNV